MTKIIHISIDAATANMFFNDGINLLNGSAGFPAEQRGKPIIIGDHPIRDVILGAIEAQVGSDKFHAARRQGGIHNTFLYVPVESTGHGPISVGIGSMDTVYGPNSWELAIDFCNGSMQVLAS